MRTYGKTSFVHVLLLQPCTDFLPDYSLYLIVSIFCNVELYLSIIC